MRIPATSQSTIVATHGDRSSGPIDGRMRRNRRRYGSDTSYRKRWIRFSQGEYGMRIQLVRMYAKITSVYTTVKAQMKLFALSIASASKVTVAVAPMAA